MPASDVGLTEPYNLGDFGLRLQFTVQLAAIEVRFHILASVGLTGYHAKPLDTAKPPTQLLLQHTL